MVSKNLLRLGCTALASIFAGVALAYEIDRVDPPFWWQGMVHPELQLMVYGDGVGVLKPEVDAPGVTVTRVVRVDSPNYLFVYLHIEEEAQPGEFDIVFRHGAAALTYSYQLLRKNPDASHTRGFDTSDAIYLITPDRFANGDTRNDNIDGMGDKVDRQQWGGRHGGDIAGIRAALGYIEDMGFTAIWLNPLLENAMPSYSYHGYSTTDYYRVDPRYGSNVAYRDLVAAAKARGIGVIMDMIVNHIGSEHPWMEDLPTRDWINNDGKFVITSHERTALIDPYASQADIQAFADGWFVDTMPDLNQRNPLLADYLTQNAIWWIEYLGLAGIRMDTYPYPDKHYMTEWTRRVMQEYPEFNVVGEEWSANQPTVAYWQKGKENHDGYVSYLPSLMDFPLQEAMRAALLQEETSFTGWVTLYRSLANDFLYADPNSLVIFPDNHDMSRIYTQLGEDYDLWRMAMLYVLTMRGTPQIYYGTEILMSNRASGDHGLIRSDFPGGWPGDKKNAFIGKGLSRQAREAQVFLKRLLNWRKAHDVVHDGSLMQFNPQNGVYVYFRYDEDEKVMVAMNKGKQAVSLNAARFAEMLTGHASGRDVITGKTLPVTDTITINARDVLLLELE